MCFEVLICRFAKWSLQNKPKKAKIYTSFVLNTKKIRSFFYLIRYIQNEFKHGETKLKT